VYLELTNPKRLIAANAATTQKAILFGVKRIRLTTVAFFILIFSITSGLENRYHRFELPLLTQSASHSIWDEADLNAFHRRRIELSAQFGGNQRIPKQGAQFATLMD
jgi:hypothetical protein